MRLLLSGSIINANACKFLSAELWAALLSPSRPLRSSVRYSAYDITPVPSAPIPFATSSACLHARHTSTCSVLRPKK